MLPRIRPACPDGEDLRPGQRAQPPQLRKSQVVADLRAHGCIIAAADDQLFPAVVMFAFAAEGEWMNLAIDAGNLAGGFDDRSAVAASIVGTAFGVTVLH